MRISGKQLVTKNHKRVEIQRGGEKFQLTLCPTPPGWHERMKALELAVWPAPPRRALLDGKGRPITNPKTGRVEIIEDEADHGYRAKTTEVGRRFQCLRLAESLKDDDNFELEVKEPEGSSGKGEWMQYATALVAEMTHPDTGFTDDEIASLLDHVDSLGESVLDMDEAVDFFSPETP